MIRQIAILTVVIQLSSLAVVVGQPNDSLVATPRQSPRLSGFVDVRGVHSNDSNNKSEFSIGQAELDLEQSVSNRVALFLAAAYNSESGAIDLGAAELQLTLRDDSLHFFNNISLIAGQFDVPFGIGCRYFASPDCEAVTSPWFSHRVGNWNGWNDYGARLTAASTLGTGDFFIVNGYEESIEIVHRVYNLATGFEEESLEVIVTSPAAAFGGRLGIIPLDESVEFGLSSSVGIDDRGGAAKTLFGGDFTYDGERLGMRSEFIYSSLDRNGRTEVARGFYVQAHYHIASWRTISRYAAVREGQGDWESQYSAGLAMPVASGTEVRCEIIRTPENRMVGMVQIVAGF